MVTRSRNKQEQGRMSREKGKRGERWVAQYLSGRGFTARRGVQFSGGKDSPDIICDALNAFHFEVKFVEKLNLRDAYKQSKFDAGDKIPLVVHKKGYESAKVCIDLWDFVDLLQLVYGKVDGMNNFKAIRDKYDKIRGINSSEQLDTGANLL